MRRERVTRLRALARAIAGVAALLAALCCACGVQDVTVARYMTEGVGGPCMDSTDCDPTAFCSKDACDAPLGECQPIVACGDELLPTCGCDGVTYWNDCLRQQLGIPASIQGPCMAPHLCGGRKGTACPTAGALCARLVSPPDMCDPSAAGECWVLPPECPPVDGGAVWQSCAPRPPMCADFCTAIRSEVPFRSFGGPSCP